MHHIIFLFPEYECSWKQDILKPCLLVKDLEKTTNGGSPNFLDTLLHKSRNIISTSSIAPEDLDAYNCMVSCLIVLMIFRHQNLVY
jgi:hypothetical protein